MAPVNTARNPERGAESVHCTHCGLPVPRGLVVEDAGEQFCCNGCRTVYEVIHRHGLEQYYEVARTVGEEPRSAGGGGRSYEEYDDPAFMELYCPPAGGDLRRVELYLEGVHCAACVWLVEKVPLAVPGVHEARLDIGRSVASITWNPADTPLSNIARFIDSLGYPVHPYRGVRIREIRRREDRRLLIRIAVAAASAGNVMLIAIALYGSIPGGMDLRHERYFHWSSLLIALPAVLYSAGLFFRGAWGALRTRTLHMDLPISLGIGVGFVAGLVNTVRSSGEIYFDSVTMLIFLLLVGRWLERRRKREASDAAELLYSLAPSSARRVEERSDGENGIPRRVREVPVEALLPEDLVEVPAEGSVPADGEIVEGRSTLDLSLITGESRPVDVSPGDEVHAGTLNLGAPLLLRVRGTGENTRVGRLMRIVEEAARRKAPLVRMADRLAGWFVAIVLGLAAFTGLLWAWLDPSRAVDHTVALLIVTCPCALGLATPLAVSVAVGRAARAGLLIKGGDVVEALSRPGRLLLDKTGTLTEGRMALVRWEGREETGRLAAELERHSNHPVARAFVRHFAAGETREDAEPPEDFRQVMGGGVQGLVRGRRVLVGSPAYAARELGPLDGENARAVESMVDEALSPVVVAVDGRVCGVAGMGDPLRPDAESTLRRLESLGWKLEMISGDHPRVVARVADALGLDPAACRGGVLPEEKLAVVEEAARRETVLMVGDGVNDAAALSAATVGISVHGGAEASLAAADVFLTEPGIFAVADLVEGSRRTVGVIRRNLVFSLCYNIVGAGLAVAGMIHPLAAALLMPLSSITVVTSSYKSRTFLVKDRTCP